MTGLIKITATMLFIHVAKAIVLRKNLSSLKSVHPPASSLGQEKMGKIGAVFGGILFH